MSSDIRCGDPVALAGYLYGEMAPAERDAVEQHLAACEICASEIDGLRGTREQLAAWTPPDSKLGFRIVSEVLDPPAPAAPRVHPVVAASPGWWHWTSRNGASRSGRQLPSWAQAAAAVMLFAGGALLAALMNVEVRYDQAGMTIRTGWSASAPNGASAFASAATDKAAGEQVAGTVSAKDLGALESRIRAEFMQARSAEESGKGVIAQPQQGTQTALDGDAVMQRVRQIVAESEQRQQRELALRLTQAVRELDTNHRADLERIERTVSPMEEQQRQMLNYITRVSQQR